MTVIISHSLADQIFREREYKLAIQEFNGIVLDYSFSHTKLFLHPSPFEKVDLLLNNSRILIHSSLRYIMDFESTRLCFVK